MADARPEMVQAANIPIAVKRVKRQIMTMSSVAQLRRALSRISRL